MNVVFVTCLLALFCALPFSLEAQPLYPDPISAPATLSVSASGHSYMPILSEDRRHIVFLSGARNLVTNDNLATYLDIFRHELMTGQTLLISRSTNWSGGGNADCRSPSVSSNGHWIAFASSGGDLLPLADSNGVGDVFLTDADSLVHTLVSQALDGKAPVNVLWNRNLPLSDKPQLSADARWIAFESFATNLTSELDLNQTSDVFARDRAGNETLLVSVALGGGASGKGKSEIVSITPDGNFILFASTATNLVANNPTNRNLELYLRDLRVGATTWIGHSNTIPLNSPGGPAAYACRWASMTKDAGFVLYKVEFPSSTDSRVHLYDREIGSNILVTARARVGTPVHMSSDARFIAYDETNHVFLWDRQADTRSRVSTNDTAHSPVVSDDGATVAFLGGSAVMPFQIYCRNLVTSDLHRLTETLSGAPSSKDHYRSFVTIDPAGEFIVFESPEGLLPGDYNQATDIYVYQLTTGETRLISRAHSERSAFTSVASTRITNNCVSSDGTRVLFFSHDSNIVPGDTNAQSDAFVRDLQAGQTFGLVTNDSGTFEAANIVLHGVLSSSGRYAVLGLLTLDSPNQFVNYATHTILRQDLDTGQSVPVVSNLRSVRPIFLQTPIAAFSFSVSAEGQRVAYPSNDAIIVVDLLVGVQTNLTPSGAWTEPLVSPDARYVTYVNMSSRELAMTDLTTGARTIINSAYVRGAAFSRDSRSIVYGAPAGPTLGIYVRSIAAATDALVCTNCTSPGVSADARFVVYERADSGARQIELKDLVAGTVTLVTRNVQGTGAANRDATGPNISADGRYVAYTSKATNLTTDVPTGWNNLYVYDRLQGTTIRITGASGNSGYGSGSASRPVLGPNGRTLVFQSFASDFVANDFNDTRDIFLLTLGGDDTDNDGMPDDWEQTHFSTTDRDGTGDYDQDGQTDLAEYLSGTNPNDNQSVLEVLQITSVITGQRQLIWNAQPGKSYRLEYKSDLTGAAWTSLGQVITATQPTASALDTTAAAEKRFYRVALVQ